MLLSVAFWIGLIAGICAAVAAYKEYKGHSHFGWSLVTAVLAILAFAASSLEQKQSEEELKRYFTGGDSFLYLNFSEYPLESSGKEVSVAIRHVGKYPLQDIIAAVHSRNRNGNDVSENKYYNLASLQSSSEEHNRTWRGVPIPTADINTDYYIVLISASNGQIIQKVWFEQIDNKWVTAYRVMDCKGVTDLIEPVFHSKFSNKNLELSRWPGAATKCKSSKI